jgi:hypothetical protein
MDVEGKPGEVPDAAVLKKQVEKFQAAAKS